MKTFASELAHNYASYTFGYAHYAQREAGDTLADIYNRGYLPYSGARDAKDIFYLARSARILLPQFELSSENRRIAKKFDGVLERQRMPLGQFNCDEKFFSFCLTYFSVLHGERAMSQERLESILACGLITDVIAYRGAEGAAAYVLEVRGEALGHYWFSFYAPHFAKQSFGMWLMLDALRQAKESGLERYYLGTVYGDKALYKANFEPLEWWDGAAWNADDKRLRELAHGDEAHTTELADEWKLSRDLFT